MRQNFMKIVLPVVLIGIGLWMSLGLSVSVSRYSLGTAFILVMLGIFLITVGTYLFPNAKKKTIPGTKSYGVSYSHKTFKPGSIVLISTKIGLTSPLAGKVLLVTTGVYYPKRDLKIDLRFLVPVLWADKVWYVSPDVVTRNIHGESLPTLGHGQHGYGCRCYSCVSQLVER